MLGTVTDRWAYRRITITHTLATEWNKAYASYGAEKRKEKEGKRWHWHWHWQRQRWADMPTDQETDGTATAPTNTRECNAIQPLPTSLFINPKPRWTNSTGLALYLNSVYNVREEWRGWLAVASFLALHKQAHVVREVWEALSISTYILYGLMRPTSGSTINRQDAWLTLTWTGPSAYHVFYCSVMNALFCFVVADNPYVKSEIIIIITGWRILALSRVSEQLPMLPLDQIM